MTQLVFCLLIAGAVLLVLAVSPHAPDHVIELPGAVSIAPLLERFPSRQVPNVALSTRRAPTAFSAPVARGRSLPSQPLSHNQRDPWPAPVLVLGGDQGSLAAFRRWLPTLITRQGAVVWVGEARAAAPLQRQALAAGVAWIVLDADTVSEGYGIEGVPTLISDGTLAP